MKNAKIFFMSALGLCIMVGLCIIVGVVMIVLKF